MKQLQFTGPPGAVCARVEVIEAVIPEHARAHDDPARARPALLGEVTIKK